MGMRMLIDATHLEETRVVLVKGTRLEEFDYETSTKQVLKGNIYLARVTRVEPSLQAAFVEYGGNRHGFLAFGEIHPDYYQIPIADRQALLAQQAEEEARAAEAEEEELEAGEDGDGEDAGGIETIDGDFDAVEEITPAGGANEAAAESEPMVDAPPYWSVPARADAPVSEISAEPDAVASASVEQVSETPAAATAASESLSADAASEAGEDGDAAGNADAGGELASDEAAAGGAEAPDATESAGANAGGGRSRRRRDDGDDRRPRRTSAFRRYKIQEVIKRRQIMLVQVVKEERGNKGAALTTYLSLAGRYCVLMPNTARGGGISRKIQSPADRKRLKAITSELDIQDGMGVIVRTAGMERSKPEIKRDFEFLLRTWDSIRERTLESTAPALIYEEADLIKRSIRDLYSEDIDEVLVEGEQGHAAAKDFMQMLMPSHADRVKLYQDKIPLFHRYQVEQQLDSMFTPTVQLRSGGYIVINPTEALVSIDINSGKSTREHNIEETAYKTNLEAAEEIARQLRLRDLAGLVVIDFIDMEDHRNIRNVERRLKECLRGDRARIQVGRISGFGLLEMSRQRLRPSLIESSTMPCPHCQGRGYVRSTESTALQVLRAIEEEGIRDRAGEIVVSVPAEVAVYLLNHKRDRLGDIERRYAMRVLITVDSSLVPPDYKIERAKPRQPGDVLRPELVKHEIRPITQQNAYANSQDDLAEEGDAADEDGLEQDSVAGSDDGAGGDLNDDGSRRRRRRRRRRGRRPADGSEPTRDAEFAEGGATGASGDEAEGDEMQGEAPDAGDDDGAEGEAPFADGTETGDGQPRRRRGRRGGRRRRRNEEGAGPAAGNGNGGEDLHGEATGTVAATPRRNEYSPEAGGFMTPAALGAMLDGRGAFEFDEEERVSARPAAAASPAPVAAPVAPVAGSQPKPDAPEVAAAPAPEPTPAAPTPEPASAPVHTGPVFETVVVSTDGTADKVETPPPAPKRGWWSR